MNNKALLIMLPVPFLVFLISGSLAIHALITGEASMVVSGIGASEVTRIDEPGSFWFAVASKFATALIGLYGMFWVAGAKKK